MSTLQLATMPLAPTAARSRCRAWLAWLLFVLVWVQAIHWGMDLRQYLWDNTEDIRFVNSVSNAIEWGRYANRVGVLNVYDQLLQNHGPEGDFNGEGRFALDYPPLRLQIAAWWAKWAQEHYPPPAGQPLVWQRGYEFTSPMIQLNLACELLATVGMFLMVYRWMRICQLAPPQRWWILHWPWAWDWSRGWGQDEGLERTRSFPSTVGLVPATLAALLIWFNPALLFNAHVYPQWDAWLLPAFVFAFYFGMRNAWLPAGLVVGVTAMGKGQIMLALPVLIAWPLLLGNIGGTLRLLIGFGAGVGLTLWPWMIQTAQELRWMNSLVLGGLPLLAIALLPRRSWRWQVARGLLALAGGLAICFQLRGSTVEVMLPWLMIPLSIRTIGVVVFGAIVSLAFLGTWRMVPTWVAALWAAGLALTVPLFNASTAWYEIGIVYGTRHWRQLFWGHASNLGSILQLRYQWQYTSIADLSWLGLDKMPIRQVMIDLYIIAMVACIIAGVRHRRNHDPRFLLAISTPFLMAYTLLPQMIERYLLWPAALLSAFAAISVGGFLLWLVLSLLACAMMLEYMLGFVPRAPMTREWLVYLSGTFPDIGWGIMALAAVVLYLSVRSSRRRPWELLEPAEATSSGHRHSSASPS